MPIHPSKRVQSIGGYAFAEVDQLVAELKAKGVDVIDFGVGDPTLPTPKFIREACKAALDNRASAGYPSYIGQTEFRRAAAYWLKRRFGVALDPETEVTSTIGSKEAVFHFHEGFVDPGDVGKGHFLLRLCINLGPALSERHHAALRSDPREEDPPDKEKEDKRDDPGEDIRQPFTIDLPSIFNMGGFQIFYQI